MMTLLVGLLIAVICTAIGFIGGKLYTEKNFNKAELQQQIEDSQQQMEKFKTEVSNNLTVTQKLMAEMKNNYDNIVVQMNHTTKLLEKPRNQSPSMPFFSPDATDHLVALGDNEKKRHNEALISQPSDYSAGPSGLFKQSGATNEARSEKI